MVGSDDEPKLVLVMHPPLSIAADFIDYPYFSNLGALQIAAVLQEHFRVEVRDAFAMAGSTLRWLEDERAWLGCSVSELLAGVGDAAGLRPDAVVVAYPPFCRPPHRDPPLAELLECLRSSLGPDVPIVLADAYQSGQHYVAARPAEISQAYPEIDCYLQYEAEASITALLEQQRPLPTHVVGEQIANLDDLPFPAWSEIDVEAFHRFRGRVVRELGRSAWAFPITGRTLPLVTSRGCPFECAHCSSNPDRRPGEAKTQRRYSPERLHSYATTLAREHGTQRLFALDELINVSCRHFDHFLAVVSELDLAFEVPNGMRADYLRRHHFARMHGRVTTVSVSAESGSQAVVNEIVGKKLDLGAITKAAENAHAAGVPLMIHYMIGLPGESEVQINETLEFALDLFDRFAAWPAVQFATPLPGTRMAAGRALRVVYDWGPRFQQAASAQGSDAVAPEVLERFKRTFDERLAASRGPKKLIMNVTYVCNNHCTFCAVGTRTQVDGHPTRQREHLAKHAREGVRMLDIDGGEPTLNPELVGLIKYARSLGYERVNVTTNGRMSAYPGFASRLVNSGLTTLLFSIHGADARTHAAQVGVAEAFDQSVLGIQNSLATKPDHVELGMNITLTKGNTDQLPEVAQLAYDLGLRWLNVQFLTPFGRATAMVAPDTADAAAITMGVIDRWRDRLKIKVINLPYCFMPGYEKFLEGDRLKLARHMVFVNNETVNLHAYLAQRRTKKDVCATCPHACYCGGFYELERVPEPPWLISADDLVRRVEV